MHACMNEWMNEAIIQWMNERMNEWMNARMNEWTNVPNCCMSYYLMTMWLTWWCGWQENIFLWHRATYLMHILRCELHHTNPKLLRFWREIGLSRRVLCAFFRPYLQKVLPAGSHQFWMFLQYLCIGATLTPPPMWGYLGIIRNYSNPMAHNQGIVSSMSNHIKNN